MHTFPPREEISTFRATAWVLYALALAPAVLPPVAFAEDLSVGAKVDAAVQAELLGRIAEVGSKGGYRATVQMRGTFANGVPFRGVGAVQVATTQALLVGDPVRGRLRTTVKGRVVDRSAAGISLELDGDIVRVRWMTPEAYGGASKGGGTNT